MPRRNSELTKILERLAALEATVNPEPTPEPAPQIDSLERDAQGKVIVSPDTPEFEDRMKERRKSEDAEADEEWGRRTAAVPPGQWRDPTGLVRDQHGRLASVGEREEAGRKEVWRKLKDERNDH